MDSSNACTTTTTTTVLMGLIHDAMMRLEQCKFESAAIRFHQALKLVGSRMDQEARPHPHGSDPSSVKELDSFLCQAVPQSSSSMLGDEEAKAPCMLGNNPLYFHTSAFHFLPNNQSTTSSTPLTGDQGIMSAEQGACIVTASLLYNIGLAYHLQALLDPAYTRRIRNAIRMYDLALEVLQRGAEGGFLQMDKVKRRIQMAIFNNKAHAANESFDVLASLRCLQIVRHILGQCQDLEEIGQYHHFRINVLLYAESNDCRPSPAA